MSCHKLLYMHYLSKLSLKYLKGIEIVIISKNTVHIKHTIELFGTVKTNG